MTPVCGSDISDLQFNADSEWRRGMLSFNWKLVNFVMSPNDSEPLTRNHSLSRGLFGESIGKLNVHVQRDFSLTQNTDG